MKIVSIKDKRIAALIADPNRTSVKGFTAIETRKAVEMITAIQMMTHPLQLLAVPAWRAHELIPGQPGKWSLRLTPNFRITFRVDIDRQEVRLLDVEDYH